MTWKKLHASDSHTFYQNKNTTSFSISKALRALWQQWEGTHRGLPCLLKCDNVQSTGTKLVCIKECTDSLLDKTLHANTEHHKTALPHLVYYKPSLHWGKKCMCLLARMYVTMETICIPYRWMLCTEWGNSCWDCKLCHTPNFPWRSAKIILWLFQGIYEHIFFDVLWPSRQTCKCVDIVNLRGRNVSMGPSLSLWQYFSFKDLVY